MTFTQNTFIFIGIVAALVDFALLIYLLLRARTHVGKGPRDDMASMMFLLQTMRDLLDQQKNLAREFNKALDSRVETIKQNVSEAKDELKAVRESVLKVSSDVERVRAEASEFQRVPAAPKQPSNITTFTPVPLLPSETPKEYERPVLRVLAMPKEPDPTGDILDAWVGLDFAGDDPDPLGFEVPDVQPVAPHDADAARNAFRALLDLGLDGNDAAAKPQKVEERFAPPRNGNARPVPPIHARVYEYNDAGMSIAQIAQELGIGKGEVRLILSLRKTRDA